MSELEKFPFSVSIVITFHRRPSPPTAPPSSSFPCRSNKKKAQHQHWGESPGKSPNNVATSLVTCSSAQTGQPPENDWYPWILMNAFFFFPPLSAHLDEISFWAHSNRAGHYRRIVIIFFSLCLLCGKHSWFCCYTTDPKRKKTKTQGNNFPKDWLHVSHCFLSARRDTNIKACRCFFFSFYCVKASVLIIFLSQRNGDGHIPLDVRWKWQSKKSIVSFHSNEIFTLGHKKPSVMCF